MEAVSNATVLVLLSRIDELRLLNVCEKIILPDEVYDELFDDERHIQSQTALRKIELHIENPKKQLIFGCGKGECAALSLAIEKRKMFLSDDNEARAAAHTHCVKVLGTAGIVLFNLKHRTITKKEALIILDKLVAQGYYLSADLYREIRTLIESV